MTASGASTPPYCGVLLLIIIISQTRAFRILRITPATTSDKNTTRYSCTQATGSRPESRRSAGPQLRRRRRRPPPPRPPSRTAEGILEEEAHLEARLGEDVEAGQETDLEAVVEEDLQADMGADQETRVERGARAGVEEDLQARVGADLGAGVEGGESARLEEDLQAGVGADRGAGMERD